MKAGYAMNCNYSCYDSMPVGVAVLLLDKKLTILYANMTFYSLLGCSEEYFGSVFGWQFAPAADEECRTELFELMHRAAASRSSCSSVVKVNLGSGEKHLYLTFCLNSLGSGGEGISMLCFAQDAQSWAELSRTLELERSRRDTVAELSGQILFDYDIRRDEISMFGAWAERIGAVLSAEDFVSRLCAIGFLHRDDGQKLGDFLSGCENYSQPKTVSARFMFDGSAYAGGVVHGKYICGVTGEPEHLIAAIYRTPSDYSMMSLPLGDGISLDPLTGILSRDSIEHMVSECIATRPGERHALILIELDRYKQLNESRGHIFGDMILKDICSIIASKLGEYDLFGRYTGAVLCILCRNISSEGYARELADTINQSIRSAFSERKTGFVLSCNIGVAFYDDSGDSSASMFRRADIDMYKSKNKLKSKIKFI